MCEGCVRGEGWVRGERGMRGEAEGRVRGGSSRGLH